MKRIILSFVVFLSFNSHARDLFCGVYLVDISTDSSLAHIVLEKSGVGIITGNSEGSGFFIENRKKRFLRKSLVLSQVSFAHTLINEGDKGSAKFQFYLESKPNKYGIFTKSELLGSEVVVNSGEIKFDIISDKYTVKSYCNMKL
jgi:hypothetical protein